jgi:hypothetical protein
MFQFDGFHNNVSQEIRQNKNQEFLFPFFIEPEKTEPPSVSLFRIEDNRIPFLPRVAEPSNRNDILENVLWRE